MAYPFSKFNLLIYLAYFLFLEVVWFFFDWFIFPVHAICMFSGTILSLNQWKLFFYKEPNFIGLLFSNLFLLDFFDQLWAWLFGIQNQPSLGADFFGDE